MRGTVRIDDDPAHAVTIRVSLWRHRAWVQVGGQEVGGPWRWSSPGGRWAFPVPALAAPLEVDIACHFRRLHYPHAHVVRVACGDVRGRVAPRWLR